MVCSGSNCKTERDGTRVVGRGGAAGWINERSPSVMMMRVLEVGRFLNVKTHELRLHLQGARWENRDIPAPERALSVRFRIGEELREVIWKDLSQFSS